MEYGLAPEAPSLISASKPAPGSKGLWQDACILCGPVCNMEAYPEDPAVHFSHTLRQGEIQCQREKWDDALVSYYECLRLVPKAKAASSQSSAVHAGASFAQLRVGNSKSALRHARQAIKLDASSVHAHVCMARAHEAIGHIAAAHATYGTAAAVAAAAGTAPPPPYERIPLAEVSSTAMRRLKPLDELLASAVDGGGSDYCSGGHAAVEAAVKVAESCGSQDAAAAAAAGTAMMRQHALATLYRLANDANDSESSDDEGAEAATAIAPRWPQRIVQMLALDAAIQAAAGEPPPPTTTATDASRSSHRALSGWLCACSGMRLWLLRKSAELGLDLMERLVSPDGEVTADHSGLDHACARTEQQQRAATTKADQLCQAKAMIRREGVERDLAAAMEAEESDPLMSRLMAMSRAEESDSDEYEDEGEPECFVSQEIDQPGGVGRQLLQIELHADQLQLTLSFFSLETYDLDNPTRSYTFALGLTSAILLEAKVPGGGGALRVCEMFAPWSPREGGELRPADQVVSPNDVRDIVSFFTNAEGAAPPLAPAEAPPRWLCRTDNPVAPLLGAFG
jgi:tetratricopeptide (TPR) repeat protein